MQRIFFSGCIGSYIELKLDSANYSFKQGSKYLKEDDNLYEVVAWDRWEIGKFR